MTEDSINNNYQWIQIEENKQYPEKKVPLFGFLTKFKDDSIERLYLDLLREEGIDRKDFINRQISLLSSEGFERKMFMDVADFSCKFENDELNKGKRKAILGFKLRSGSYATVVIMALFD